MWKCQTSSISVFLLLLTKAFNLLDSNTKTSILCMILSLSSSYHDWWRWKWQKYFPNINPKMAIIMLLLKPWHINYYSVVGFQLQFASKLQLRLLHVEITFDTLIRDAWKFHETFHNIAFYVYLIWAEWETIFFGTERMTKDYTRTGSGVKKYTPN